MTYLQHISAEDSLISNVYGQETYKLQSGDIIYIRISSLNKEINDLFNSNENIAVSAINEAAMYFKSYTIDDKGYIEMPVIGKVHVANKTLAEVQEAIQQLTLVYFKEVYVTVKYAGFKVTILGEVRKPGVFYFYNSKATILEALGQAGDLNEFGNRENLLIVRSTNNGLKTIRVNLLDKNLLKSPDLYIQPNDVIYVEPLKSKSWKLNSYNVSIILSSISTLVLVISFVLKL
ncbi:MAG: polysaccharide export protein [Bacteroidales bacterium]|nr:polysaccharide export protein [Bacteroidales bacterium]